MATVLTASLLSNRSGNGDISVMITTSFSGKSVCSFQLPCGTLVDLEKVLCDPQGPMFWCYPWSRLLFYIEDEPLRPLDMNLQLGTFDSLVIKRGDMQSCLEKFPDTGKFLDAMRGNKFDPGTAHLEGTWTARSAPTVPADEAEAMVHEVLNGLPLHADSGLNFVARCAATWMITEAPPILLLKRGSSGKVIGCGVIGDAFPDNFTANLSNSLREALGSISQLQASAEWITAVASALKSWAERNRLEEKNVSLVLVSLDWNLQEGLASLDHLLTKIEEEPCEFAALAHHQVSKMVHLQLRLSFCGVAEVKGPINETCVKILAELLAYKLKILKFQGVPDLKTQLSCFECEDKSCVRHIAWSFVTVPKSKRCIEVPQRTSLCPPEKPRLSQGKSAKAD
ncbi:unnamed protein product [Cladocopium goreaui]|uniref:Uncharacterized protein n=1 Tax=Cladocopium goreaui TaxID=2562237 RepID=A0A9P1CTY0_9DINO|nr:unnamed protein product [Cladocopium goreaui]